MKGLNHFLSLMEELTILLKDLLTKDEQDEMHRNIYHIRNDYQRIAETNSLIKGTEITNDHDLATNIIVISGMHFGDIIQELENIRDVLKSVKKQCGKENND